MSKNSTWMEAAIAAFDKEAFKDGDLISHEWLDWALDMPVPATVAEYDKVRWEERQRLRAFFQYLMEERRIIAANVWGEGYRIVPPDDQAAFAIDKLNKEVNKSLSKAQQILTHARLEEMSHDNARRHTDSQNRVAGLQLLMNKQQKRLTFPFLTAK